MFQHPSLANNISHTLRPNNYYSVRLISTEAMGHSALSLPSSFRIYFKANVNPVSFRSTIRTFPKAPFPTTLSSRKWLRLTIGGGKRISIIQRHINKVTISDQPLKPVLAPSSLSAFTTSRASWISLFQQQSHPQ